MNGKQCVILGNRIIILASSDLTLLLSHHRYLRAPCLSLLCIHTLVITLNILSCDFPSFEDEFLNNNNIEVILAEVLKHILVKTLDAVQGKTMACFGEKKCVFVKLRFFQMLIRDTRMMRSLKKERSCVSQ